jgi:hypothetical protein
MLKLETSALDRKEVAKEIVERGDDCTDSGRRIDEGRKRDDQPGMIVTKYV